MNTIIQKKTKTNSKPRLISNNKLIEHYLLILLVIVLVLTSDTLKSQTTPHWTFAKCFGGMEDWYFPNPNNAPHHMEMDSEGNVYIFGAYGQMMSIDGTYLPTAGGTDNTRGSFLAKFNCEGELQWTKAVKCQQFDANANWMQIKNDTIYIMGDVRFSEPYNTYFLDSMVYASEVNYPYTFPWLYESYYNYFTKIDLDGNQLETHFLHKGEKKRFYWQKTVPFNVGVYGNYYLLGQYRNDLSLGDKYSYGIDSIAITDSIEMDINFNALLFKFNKNFDLLWYKPIIDSISGATMCWIFFNDLKTDSEDNLYYVGKAQLRYNDSTAQEFPPGTMYLADGHTIELQQHGNDIGFIMKIDSAGTIQWVKQMYRETDTTYGGYSEFYSIDIDQENNKLFVSGCGGAKNENYTDKYAIFPNGDIFEAPCFDCSGTQNASYLICFNKETGDLLWHSTPYTEGGNRIGNVEYANDSLYVGLWWGTALHFGDTVYMHDGSKYFTVGFSHLTYNTAGELCSVRNLRTDNGYGVYAYDTKVDVAGNIWFAGLMDADLAFGEDTSLLVSSSNIFLARYGKECPVYLDSTVVLCYGESVSIGEQEYNVGGNYQALIESPGGDTIVNLDVTVLPALSSGLPSDTIACLDNSFMLTANTGYDVYLWQDGSTGQSYSHIYTEEDTDTLTITMGKTFNTPHGYFYCEWTDTIIVVSDVCNGYKLQQQAELTVCPNPANDKIYLEYPITSSAVLHVYDNIGRLLINENINGNICEIDISQLDNGIYYIVLKSKDYYITKKLIVK